MVMERRPKTRKSPLKPAKSNGPALDRIGALLLAAAALPQAERERLTGELVAWRDKNLSTEHLRIYLPQVLQGSEPRILEGGDAVQSVEFGSDRVEFRLGLSDPKPGARSRTPSRQVSSASPSASQSAGANPDASANAIARPGDADAGHTDSFADALIQGFADAVRAATGTAHISGLAVPGREQGKPVEHRPDGRIAPIDEWADWSPQVWKTRAPWKKSA